MSFTHGGRCKKFGWQVDDEKLLITNESGKTHQYQVGEMLEIITWLAGNFGSRWFPLGNNVEKLGRGKERAGLGVAILRQVPRDITHAQGASYLGVVLEEAGILSWNGEMRGIEWKLVKIPNDQAELVTLLNQVNPTVRRVEADAPFHPPSRPRLEIPAHRPSVAEARKQFLCYELGILTMHAALATRDEGYPVYSSDKQPYQRGVAKDAIRQVLNRLGSQYVSGGISDDMHCDAIDGTANALTMACGAFWHRGRFRIGVTQKLVNLHLKYLWVAGMIPEPPHCPVDGIVRDLAKLPYDWTTNDSLDDYMQAIAKLRVFARPLSLAEWELVSFKRRNSAFDAFNKPAV